MGSNVFRPSGKFSLLGLAWAGPALLAATVPFALLLALCDFELGITSRLLLYMLFAAALGATAMLLLRMAHCRNAFLGYVLGAILGSLMYLGHFYFLPITRGADPTTSASSSSFLSPIIAEVNGWIFVDRLSKQSRKDPADSWTYFLMFLAACSALTSVTAGRVTKRAYCEVCNTWMPKRKVRLAMHHATLVAKAVQNQAMQELPQLSKKPPNAKLFSEIEIEGCAHHGTGEATLVLTASEGVYNKGEKKVELQPVVSQFPITIDDYEILAQRCPGLPALKNWEYDK